MIISTPETKLLPKMANRHGFIAGATGTGKTVTLKLLAEKFSDLGVPVFLADVKGDISSLAYTDYPVRFWDVNEYSGVPFHCTVSSFSPVLLAKLLELSESQTAILTIAMANKEITTLDELISIIAGSEIEGSKASIDTLIRKITVLKLEGGDILFSDKELDIADLMTVDKGLGTINIFDATKIIHQPTLYATSLMWLLQKMFVHLPEVGDLEKPKLVFFFDEAHLLFTDAPKTLLRTIEHTVRLIRSKGVGVYFITQSPQDIPETVLRQLGNRIQHALKAYTPKEQTAVKTAASTFRQNKTVDVETEITQLKIGEALVSFLDQDGTPTVVEKVKINAPKSMSLSPLTMDEKEFHNRRESVLNEKYLRSIINNTAVNKPNVWKVILSLCYLIIFVYIIAFKVIMVAIGGNTKRRR